MSKATLYGVGLGPGDPELLTVKAVNTIQNADVVVLPDSGSKSVAQIIIEGAKIELSGRFEMVSMPMTRDPQELNKVHDEAYEKICIWLDNGESVAFVTLGDPSFYATWTPIQRRALADNRAVETVPGIISPCSLAAKANVALCERDERLVIIPAIDGKPIPKDDNLVIMKVGRRFDEVREELLEQKRLDVAVLGERVGMKDERIEHGIEGIESPSSYFSTIVVGTSKNISEEQ